MSINRKLSKLANIIDDATQNQYLVADGSGELVFGDLTVSLIDGTNTTITKSTDPVTTLRFDTDSGFDLDDLGGGAVKIKMNSTFKTWEVPGQQDLVASGLDTIKIIPGSGLAITTNPSASPQEITFSSTLTDTDGLLEGSTNLYYTDSRVQSLLGSGNVLDIVVRDIDARDVDISGNLTVQGTTTTVNQTTLTVNDSKIFLADGNNGDVIDAGVILNYNDGSNKTAGMFRDATDGAFNFYHEYTPNVGTTLDTAHASYSLAKIKADEFVGSLDWDNIYNKDDVTFTSVEVVDLLVTGTQTINNTTNVSTINPFILLNDNPSTNVDTGVVGKYDIGGTDYVGGYFRDVSDGGKFKFFEGSTQTFTDSSTVDVNATGFTLATVVADTFEGSLDWSNITNAPSIPSFLNDLSDVDTTTTAPLDGQTIIWDAANSIFVPGDSFNQTDFDAAIALKSIDVLSDVDTTSAAPTSGDALVWDGTNWVPGNATANVTISATAPSNPELGDVWLDEATLDMYIYYPDTNGNIWVQVNNLDTPTELNDLTDVDLVTNAPNNGEALVWDAANSVFVPQAPFSQTDFDTAFAAKDTDDLSEGTTNLYYTDARVNTFLASGNAGNIVTTGYIAGPANMTIDPAAVGDDTGTLIIAGNLTVQGTTTTVNSNVVEIGDSIITLNSDETGAPSQNGGIEIERGTSTNVQLRFNETNDKWEFTNDGTTYIELGTAGTFTGTTDDVTEGSTNLYFTDARADARADIRIAAASIDALADVDTTSSAASNGDALVWDGSNWVPQAPFSQSDFDTAFALKSVDDLSDVDTTSVAPTTGDALVWDGSNFVPGNAVANVSISTTAPSNPEIGDVWLDEATLDMYIYYPDTNGNIWVQVNNLDTPTELNDLTDVDLVTTAPNNGEALVWDAANSVFVPGVTFSQTDFDNAIALKSIDVLADVDTTSNAASNGDALVWDGSNWVPQAPFSQNDFDTAFGNKSIDALSDVDTTSAAPSVGEVLQWDGSNFVPANVNALETLTSLSIGSNILSYVDEAGATTNIDLSLYLDDTNLARLTSGSLNSSTGIATFTRDDASVFTVDFSSLINLNVDSIVTVSGGVFYIDGNAQETISLEPGRTYKFNQDDSSNSTHPLRFSTTEDGTHGGGVEYTTGVTAIGTPGSSVSYTEITVTQSTPPLYYYCANHSGMGGKVAVGNAFNTDELVEGTTNLYYTDARADARIAAASVGDLSDVDITTTTPSDNSVLVWDSTLNKFVSGFSSSVNLSSAVPSNPSEGDLWLNNNTMNLYVWYTDSDSSQWVHINPYSEAVRANIGATPPANPDNGDLWVDESNLDFYIYNGTAWAQLNQSNIPTEISDLTDVNAAGVLDGQVLVYDIATGDFIPGDAFSQSDFDTAFGAKSIDALSDVDTTSATPNSGQALVWDGANWAPGTVSAGNFTETTTTLTGDSVNQKLVYTDETGTANDIDLSWAVDDTNLARITSGTLDNATGIATFTRDDATTFTVDFSALFDDTNTYLSALAFDTGTGVLTGTLSDASTVTVDLDGRYLETLGSIDGHTDVDITSSAPTDGQALVWDAANSKFIPGDSFSQTDFDNAFALKSVDALSDVDTTSAAPTSGDALVWDGSNWVPGNATANVSISTTAPSNPELGDVWLDEATLDMFVYYPDTNGNIWVQVNNLDTPTELNDLTDVDLVTNAPSNGEALVWDAANSVFVPGVTFSQSDFDTAFTAKSTDDLSEGSTNLYYTDARADARIAAASIDALSDVDTTSAAPAVGEVLRWNGTNFVPGSVNALETLTTLTADSVNQRLQYTDEAGTVNNIDLSWTVDDTNLARITSGSLNGSTGIATFTRDDASTFTVDFSPFFDDTNLSRITSGTVNAGTLTLTRDDASTIAIDVSSLIDIDSTALVTVSGVGINSIDFSSMNAAGFSGGVNTFAFSYTGYAGGGYSGPAGVMELGRKYLEVEFTTLSRGAIGINGTNVDLTSGNVGGVASNMSGFTVGDVLGIVYDTTTREVYYSKNGANWSPTDPNTGAGYSISGNSGDIVQFDFRNTSGSQGSTFHGDLNTGAITYPLAHAIPAGTTPYSGTGTAQFLIDGAPAATVSFEPGRTYIFDQSDTTNLGHPLKLSETEDGTHNSGSEYTIGVTTVGSPGTVGSYTQIEVFQSTPTLYYYCANHSGMGGGIAVGNVLNVGDLADVDTTSNAPTDGQALVWDAASSTFVPGDSFSQTDFDTAFGNKSIDALSDVDTTTTAPVSGDTLVWNGSNFVPGNSAANVTISTTAPSNPEEGDLWYDEDYGDLFVYVTDSSGTSQWVAVVDSQLPAALTISSTPPTNPNEGDLWVDEDDMQLYTYYIDVDSAQWVQITPEYAVAISTLSTTQPTTGYDGELWFDTVNNLLYVYDGTAWQTVGSTVGALNDLSDVDTATTPPTNGDTLVWNSTTSKFEPGLITTYTDADVDAFLGGGTAGNIITTGYLAGPASFVIDPAGIGDNTGTVIIAGNLQVDGVTTTINSTTVNVNDLNIVLGDGSLNGPASDGGGITLDLGTNGSATILYEDSTASWRINKNLNLGGNDIENIGSDGYNLPVLDGTNRQVIMTDGSGTLTFEDLDTIHTEATNQTGSTILKGTPVYQTGTSGNAMTVAPADASSSVTMPAVGVLEQDLAAGATGFVIHMGRISGVDTSAFNEGDIIYVAAGGGYTNVAPAGEGNLLQNLGRVTKVHATNGAGVIMGAGRTNAVPNLNSGNIFIGNASNQAVTASFATTLTSGLGNNSIDALSDVDTTSAAPTSGDALVWDGSNFVPQAPFSQTDFDTAFALKSIDGLADVDTTTTAPVSGDTLVWDGSNFVPGNSVANLTISTTAPSNPDLGDMWLDEATLDMFVYYPDTNGNIWVQVNNLDTPTELNDLTDVDLVTNAPTDGEALVWDAANSVFVPGVTFSQADFDTAFALKSIDALADVDTTSAAPSTGDALVWDGSNFVPQAPFSQSDFDTAFAAKDTDDLSEGTTNLYYTNARADARVNLQTGANLDLSNKSTTDLAEGTNLYYTDARVDSYVSGGTLSNIVTTGYLRGPASFTIDPAGHGDNTGTVVIAGNLQVDGVTTAINSTTINVDDKNLELANGSTSAANSNGGGITLQLGTDGLATMLYNSATDTWDFNKTIGGTINDISNHSIDGLSDVDTTSNAPSTGDSLVWDGSNFVPGNQVANLTISTTAPLSPELGDMWLDEATLDMFVYYPDTNGNIWVQVNNLDTPTELNDLTDVDLVTTAPVDGQALIWDNANSVFVPGDSFSQADFDTAFGLKSIDALADVDTTSVAPASGDTLVWDGSNFVPADPGGRITLSASTPSPAITGDLWVDDATLDTYVYDGSAWAQINQSNIPTEISDLVDVDATGVANGQTLVYNTTSNQFEPGNAFSQTDFDTAFALKSIGALSDVDITSTAPTDGQVLVWDNANSEFVPGTIEGYASGDFDTDFATKTTDDLTEGSTNLYYTDARVDTYVSGGTLSNIVTTGYLRGPASFVIDPAAHGDDTGTVVIAGNLQVDGVTTQINSTTLTVDDLNVVMGSGSTSAASSNGGGITLDLGSDGLATIAYASATDTWNFNKTIGGTINDISNHSIDGLSDVDTTTTAPSTGDALVWNGTNFVPGDATANVTISATAPSNPSLGDVWLDEATLDMYIYYPDTNGNIWVQVNNLDTPTELNDLTDVDLVTATPTDGQALIWDNANSVFVPGDSFSQADFDTAFTAKSTDNLSEGSTNLYYTDTRVDTRIGSTSINALSDVDTTSVAPTDGQTLVWDNANSVWEPGTITGYTDADVTAHLLSFDGSIIPDTNIAYDLGSTSAAWRDVYIGPGSLYMNNTQVLSEDAITSGVKLAGDTNQHVHLVTHGTGETTLETSQDMILTAHSNADITLNTSNGHIVLNGNVVMQGKFITEYPTVTVSGGVFVIDGASQAILSLEPGRTYRFDQSDASNTTHPFRFSTTSDGTHNSGTNYTTGVTEVGTPGTAGAYTEIEVTQATPTLYYYCGNHSGMGASVGVGNIPTDITTVAPTDGQALIWDNATSKFIPGDSFSQTDFDTAFTLKSIGDLSDVDTTGAADNSVLVWDATSGTYAPGFSSSVNLSGAVPSNPSEGDLWLNNSTMNLYVWYTDSDSSQWVHINPYSEAVRANIGATPPANPDNGDLWVDESNLDFYIYNGTAWAQLNQSNIPSELSDLIDVSTAGVVDGETLVWDSAQGIFVAGASFSQGDFDSAISLVSIDDLADVDTTTTTPTDGQSLIWDNANSKFVPGDSFSQTDFDTAYAAKIAADTTFGANVIVTGDLTVNGTTTTINTTTLDVEDLNITVANGAADAAAANGAGLTADLGTDGTATITYNNTTDTWDFNKTIGGTINDISNHSIGGLSDVDITTTAPSANHQILKWNGSEFVIGEITAIGPVAPTNPDTGQLWFDTADQYNLTMKIWDGSVWQIAGGGSGAVEVSTNAPAGPRDGDLWIEDTTMNLYVYYEDADSSQWIQLNNNPSLASQGIRANVEIGATAPFGNLEAGDLWYNSDDGSMYVYYEDVDTSQWVQVVNPFAQLSLFDLEDVTDGTANQVLTTDGAGNATFQDVPRDIGDLTDNTSLLDINLHLRTTGADLIKAANASSHVLELDRTVDTGEIIQLKSLGVQQGSINIDANNNIVIEADNQDVILTGTEVQTNSAIRFNAGAGNTFIHVEGTTDDAFETSFVATEPTADRTVTFKDETGTVALVSDIPTSITDLGIVDGTLNQVLKTDGNGNFTFQNAQERPTAYASDAAPTVGDEKPGDLWYNTTDGSLYVLFEDVDTEQWVQVVNPFAQLSLFDLEDITDGTNLQVLTTDGAGNATFQDVPRDIGDLTDTTSLLDINLHLRTTGADLIKSTVNSSHLLELNRTGLTGDVIKIDFNGTQQGTIGTNSTNDVVITSDLGNIELLANNNTVLTINDTETVIDAPLKFSSTAGNTFLSVEGSVDDAKAISFTVTEPTFNRTVTFKDEDGTVALISDIPTDLTDLGIADGTINQVLKTDGNGNFSFQNAAAKPIATAGDTAPEVGDEVAGDLWYNTTDGSLYVYYQDADSIEWIQVVNPFAQLNLFDLEDITDGTNLQVLTTDGAGNATFQDIPRDASDLTDTTGLFDINLHLRTTGADLIKAANASSHVLELDRTGDTGEIIQLKSLGVQQGSINIDASNNIVIEADNQAIKLIGTEVQTDSAIRVNTGTFLHVEGATDDAFETSFAVTDPTADNTITFKDGSGTVAFVADIPTSITDLGISDGTINQVLKTDGAGNFSFQNAATKPTSYAGDNAPNVGDEVAGDLWYNTTDGSLYVLYQDVDTLQWTQVVNPFAQLDLFDLEDITDGTANQVLTTDGAGNATFQDVPRDVSDLTDTTSLLDINLHLSTTGADLIKATADQSHVLELNRTTDTGEIIQIKAAGVQQGNVSLDSSNNLVLQSTSNAIKLVGTQVETDSTIRFSSTAGNTIIEVEGTTEDAHETSIVVTEPTADRTVTFKDESGTVALVSDIPTTLTDIGITDGTLNQILSTDGAGNFSFVNNAGISMQFSDTAPAIVGRQPGDLWYHTTDGSMYVLFQDVDSTQWVQIINPNADGWVELTGSTTLPASGGNFFVDTSGGALTISLPANPVMGTKVHLIDGSGNAGTNNITVARNNSNIEGVADDVLMDYNRATLTLVYYNATNGWVLTEN